MDDRAALHRQQVEAWNGPMGEQWAANEARTEKALAPVGEALLRLAGARSGETVLDVGCGTGGTTAALAARVGQGGRVIGLDVSAPLLELARQRLAGASQVAFLQADAASHDFGSPLADLLFSRFGVMFFGDPDAAFANLRHALKRGGRMTFAAWCGLEHNPWVGVPLRAIMKVAPDLPRPGPEEPGQFSFGDQGRVRRILRAAGFPEPEITRMDFMMRFDGGSVRELAQGLALRGPIARALRDLPEARREAAVAAIEVALGPHMTPQGATLAAATWMVSVTNPI